MRQAAQEAHSDQQQRAAALEQRVDVLRGEMSAGLRTVATVEEVYRQLQGYPSTEQMQAALKHAENNEVARGELKADVVALRAATDEFEARLHAAAAEWHAALACGALNLPNSDALRPLPYHSNLLTLVTVDQQRHWPNRGRSCYSFSIGITPYGCCGASRGGAPRWTRRMSSITLLLPLLVGLGAKADAANVETLV